jgi:hypothetical protein
LSFGRSTPAIRAIVHPFAKFQYPNHKSQKFPIAQCLEYRTGQIRLF